MSVQALSWSSPAAISGTGSKPFRSTTFCRRSPRSLRTKIKAEALGETLDLDTHTSDAKLALTEFDQVGKVNGAVVIPTEDVEIIPRKPKSQTSSRNHTRKKKKKTDIENEFDRFKNRNGREVFEERAYLVGIEQTGNNALLGTLESLDELSQLADTAGLKVVGSTYQKLERPNPRTYIGSGKVAEVLTAIHALDVETVIFDEELSPGQLRSLEKTFGGEVRVCDRTALILDIFNQRAATREAALQVTVAQMEYQLPRLTRMWSHLERQAGGMVKGMGEKQIEVDKRILRDRIVSLKKELESVREHRKHYREQRSSVSIPVVSLVGYTNAGKSTLLNHLTGAGVLAENRLFATLDPTTRRMELPNGMECLLTDTVGFIQKLPTQLVAAFRATLEEIHDSSLLVHVVDISHPLAQQHTEAVQKVLAELNVEHIPMLTLWNKVDRAKNLARIREEAENKKDVICISALNGVGLQKFCRAVEMKLKDSMVLIEAFVPYDKGELVSSVHRLGIVEKVEYSEGGTKVKAHVPLQLARQLTPMRQTCTVEPLTPIQLS